jgi:hypothetical protein
MLGRCEANRPAVHDVTVTPYDYLVEPTSRYVIDEATNPSGVSVQRRVHRESSSLRTLKRINHRTKVFRDGSKDAKCKNSAPVDECSRRVPSARRVVVKPSADMMDCGSCVTGEDDRPVARRQHVR